jgi:hypothetical protein
MFFTRTYVVILQICFLQIRDFHIAKREEDIGYYAGYVGERVFYI